MLQRLLEGFRSLSKTGGGQGWDYQERRKLVRLKCRFDVIAEADGQRFRASVLDMGVLGLRLGSPKPLRPGQILKLALEVPLGTEVNQGEPIECQVVWTSPARAYLNCAGALYAPDAPAMRRSWVNFVLRELGFTSDSIYTHRRFVRADCFLPGRVSRDLQPVWADMRVCNLGVRGALLEFWGDLYLREHVKVSMGPFGHLPPLSARGQIVRVDGGLFGLEFEYMSGSQVKLLGRYLHALLSQG